LVLRVIVGLVFIVFGLNYFLNFMPPPPPPVTEEAKSFMAAIYPTKYLMVVKILEIVGGVLLLTGRLAPLGLTILVPITVNIALWDALLVKYAIPPIGTILLAMQVVLLIAYRKYFACVVSPTATVE
jgi:putative oxidoreductase